MRWGRCDRTTSIILTIVVTEFFVPMRHIGLIIKNISTDVSSNSPRAFEEGSHTTLTPLGRFGAFAGRDESIDDPGGDIVPVLGKVKSELKVDFSDKYGGLCLRCISSS